MAFRSKSIFGIALVAAVFAAASVSREEALIGKPAGGIAQNGPLYPAIEIFPTILDARHANKESVDLFNRFFAT